MAIDPAVARALDLGPDSRPIDHTIDITTTGARSGLPRRVEIWFHQVDGGWYLTGVPAPANWTPEMTGVPTPRDWYANLRANPKFTVHLKNGVTADLPATAVAVDDTTRRHVIDAVIAMLERPEYAGLATSIPAEEWYARSPLVEIVFEDEVLSSNSRA